MQGLVLEDESSGVGESESVFSFSEKLKCFFFRKEAISLSLSGSLSLAPSWPGRRLTLTFFLSWTSCFHQNKILIEELNLSFLSRNNGGGSGWFGDRYENIDLVQAEEMVLPMLKFCATLYHHHIKSEGHIVHSAKSRLFWQDDILCPCGFARVGCCLMRGKKGCTDPSIPAFSLDFFNTFKSISAATWKISLESQCFFTGWVNNFPNTEFEKLNPSNSSWKNANVMTMIWKKKYFFLEFFVQMWWPWFKKKRFLFHLLDCFGNFWVHGGKNWVLFCKFCIKIGRLFPVFLQRQFESSVIFEPGWPDTYKFWLEGRFHFSLF